MNESTYDVAVLGAGPAGCAAAVQCRRLGLSVALLDPRGEAGGLVRNAWRIENEPATGGPVSGPEYAARLQAFLAAYDIPVHPHHVAAVEERGLTLRISLFADAKKLNLKGQTPTSLLARVVVVATGTRARPAGLRGEEELAGRRVFYEVADVLPQRPRRALVVGGGEAAFDYALSLARAGAAVEIAVRGAAHRANARLAAAVEEAAPIRVRYGYAPDSLHDVPHDVVLVAVGREPNLPEIRWAGGERPPSGLKPLPQSGPTPLPHSGLRPQASTPPLTLPPGLYIAGDARRGHLGQTGMAVGDGLECAMLAFGYLQERAKRC